MKSEIRKCDVLVVGAGAAGIGAAVGAARQGAHVLVIEKYGFPGGLATAGLVGMICGLYQRGGDNARYISNGFAKEFAERLTALPEIFPCKLLEGLWVLPYDLADFGQVANTVVCQEKTIEPVYHGVVAGVNTEAEHVSNVHTLVWNRNITFEPTSVVDCTGEATVIALAGGATVKNTIDQNPAILFDMTGATTNLCKQSDRLAVMRKIVNAVEQKRLPEICRGISFVPTVRGGQYVRLKLPLKFNEARHWNSLSHLETETRLMANTLSRFFVEGVPMFKHARLRLASQVGIRAGRRAVGKSTLTEKDVLECRKYDDTAARNAWPIEIWSDGGSPEIKHLPEGDYYDIPMGCLISENLENMYMAGRCLSATDEAIASARVISAALDTGYAAGAAAAKSG
ncbi:MAG: FAD-dependent oxidoreductase [Desulfobacterales bacterium]|nr:FAD-dependent oxidoreductase [Desulfobacterales bacterium]